MRAYYDIHVLLLLNTFTLATTLSMLDYAFVMCVTWRSMTVEQTLRGMMYIVSESS